RFASAGDQTYNSPPAKVETSQEPSERGRCLACGVPPGHHSLPKNDLSRDTLQNDVTPTQQRRADLRFLQKMPANYGREATPKSHVRFGILSYHNRHLMTQQ